MYFFLNTLEWNSNSKEITVYVQNQTCIDEQNLAQREFESLKADYDSNKYIFIVLLNLIVLIVVLLVSMENSILIGLFLGSTITSFSSTWIYFSTKSKIGFGILFPVNTPPLCGVG